MLTESLPRCLSDTDTTRSAYRIVVTLLDGDVVYNARPIRAFKRARAQVAAAVRHFAPASRVVGVSVQRRGNACCSQLESPYATQRGAAAASDDDHWTIVERWDAAVVARILAQGGAAAPRETRAISLTQPRPGASLVPAAGARPAFAPLAPQPRPSAAAVPTPLRMQPCPQCAAADSAGTTPDRAAALRSLPTPAPKAHRIGVVSVVIVIALLCVTQALLTSGGKPGALLLSGTSRPAPVRVLPFERSPQPADARPLPGAVPPHQTVAQPRPALAGNAAPR